MSGPKNTRPSTLHYLDIAGIRQDTVIMKDGSLRAVILVSSINFALKNEDEQSSIVSAYVSFLNNINFPLQIVIQSRELNIENYLNSLGQKEKEQTNELLRMQIKEYISYIKELISLSKIMNKRFYVVVPYNPLSDKKKGFLPRLTETFSPASLIKMKEDNFKSLRQELQRRLDNVTSGLDSIGLNTIELDTQSLIELYYNTYNPVTSVNQKIGPVDQLRLEDNQ
ncbi:hypothetical protein IPN41_03410 [Candidatus Falkowbacteria bacterium]|jgi:hypothetical protein|nr:MAG: hypothetical protein IPN41_03410 [Candidatus Falkowbacteria bacterium]